MKEYSLSRGSSNEKTPQGIEPHPEKSGVPPPESFAFFCYEVKSKTWRNSLRLFPQEKKNPKPAALQYSWMAHLHQPETKQKTADFPQNPDNLFKQP